jgi:DNA-binding HxlR family transcriptional regulator
VLWETIEGGVAAGKFESRTSGRLAAGAQNGRMASGQEYCHFTKAVENLGDRWSLLILGHLVRTGPHGFNALASLLPGISRSVLADRLRRLEELGLAVRDPSVRRGVAPWCVTPAGAQLGPVLGALTDWALRWVPEDPAIAERDPDVIGWWLTHLLEPTSGPAVTTVIQLDMRGPRPRRVWLVLEPGKDPSLCDEDPLLGEERYVYVEASADALFRIARGRTGWQDAIDDRSVEVYGEPRLVRELPSWFRAPSVVGSPSSIARTEPARMSPAGITAG